jgi:RimJ/RimL family protein N-acetyltransferase
MAVTLREIQEPDADLLVRWRNENAQWFPAGAPFTVAGHVAWYRSSYLTDPSQQMYMVVLDGYPVGVVGMTIRDGSGELERMILGDKARTRGGLMRQGMRQLMAAYGLEHYWLRVMPDNEVTISFHKRNGFRITSYDGGPYEAPGDRSGQYVVMERSGTPDRDWGKE